MAPPPSPLAPPAGSAPRTLRNRILAAFLLVLLATSAALGHGLVQLRNIGHALAILDEGYLPLAEVAARLGAAMRQLDREHDRLARDELGPLAGYQANSAMVQASLVDACADAEGILGRVAQTVRDPNEARALEILGRSLGEIGAAQVAYEAAFRAWLDEAGTDGDRLPARLSELQRRRNELILRVEGFNQLLEGRIGAISKRATQAQSRAMTVGGALSLMAVLLSSGLAGAALLTLRPIGALTEQVQRLAAGERPGPRVERGNDEVGLLAREFETMAAAVAERDRRLKERAEDLDRLRLRLRRVLDTIRAGIVVAEHGHAAVVNPAAERLWRVAPGMALPDWLAELPPGRHEALAREGFIFDVEVVPFGMHGALLVGEDVTRRVRDRERLARSERLALVGQMLAQITHEVRNPLNAMSLNAELLADELEDLEQRDMLATIDQEIRRLETLTGRYLELARGRRAELVAAEPRALVAGVLRVEEEVLRRAGVRVALHGDAELGELDVDSLRRALRNLLRNAVEAGAHRVRIDLHSEAAAQGRRLVVRVADDGPGMDPEEERRAFDPFFTTKAQGTGLGLAISRQELEDVGGGLRCETRQGAGSSFILTLPLEPLTESGA
jgi:signal transduction histidine kinase/HAMP domain-containing protein